MERGRLEAFSDGVIAIAITLLVLDLKVPAPGGGDLAVALARQWPNFAAYTVSFLTIGVIWMNHHGTIRRLKQVDHVLLALNLLLLMCIGILPWSTSLLAEYLTEPHGARLAAAIYGGSYLLLSAAFYVMQRHILFGRASLLHDHFDTDARERVARRARSGLFPYVVATAGALVSPYVTLVICGFVAIYYALPGTIYERSG